MVSGQMGKLLADAHQSTLEACSTFQFQGTAFGTGISLAKKRG